MNAETDCVGAFETVTPDTRTTYQRWKNRVFPYKHCFAPEADPAFKDCVTVHSITKFDWLDRLRILCTGIVVTTVRTVTEHEVGSTVTSSLSYVGTSDDLKGLR